MTSKQSGEQYKRELGELNARRRYVKRNHSTRSPGWHCSLVVQNKTMTGNDNYPFKWKELESFAAILWRLHSGEATRTRKISGDSHSTFWEWLANWPREKSSIWVWTLGGAASWQTIGLYRQIDDGALTLQRAVLTDNCHYLETRLNGRLILWLDTANHWRKLSSGSILRRSMKGLGNGVDNSCGTMNAQTAEMTCRIVNATVCDLVTSLKAENLGQLRPTVSALAWSIYRHKFMEHPIEIHNRPEVSRLERRAYFGGRCIMGFQGLVTNPRQTQTAHEEAEWPNVPTVFTNAIHCLDVASMYPAIMLRHQMPWRLVGQLSDVSLSQLPRLTRQYHCIAEVGLVAPFEQYPLRRRSKVTYPRGEYYTCLSHPELCMALERGRIKSVGRVLCYRTADLFSGWVNHWWQEKQQSPKGSLREGFAKSLLNALYGRFASHGRRWFPGTSIPPKRYERWGLWYSYDWFDDEITLHRMIGGLQESRLQGGESRDAAVAIAAAITSYGRVEMQRLMELLPAHSFLYSDTDSLHVTTAGKTALEHACEIQSNTLGMLQEKAQWQWALYLAPRLYRHSDGDVTSGIPGSAERIAPTTWLASNDESSMELATRKPDCRVAIKQRAIQWQNLGATGPVDVCGFVSPPEVWRPSYYENLKAQEQERRWTPFTTMWEA